MAAEMRKLRSKVYEVGMRARMLQHQFQAHFYKCGYEVSQVLQEQTCRVQLDLKHVEVECALLEDDAPLASALAKVAREVQRAAWYEEDSYYIFETTRELRDKLEVAQATAARFEERSAELNKKLTESENRWLVCTQANLELRDQVTELQAHPPGGATKAEVDYLRTQVRKYMLCVAHDSLIPKNLVHLLIDGDGDMRARALRILLSHAKRAPLDLALVDGLCGELFQLAIDEVAHAAAALSILARVAKADGLALHFRISDLSGLLRRICRDPEIRAVALPQLAALLRFLTVPSGEGVLDDKEQCVNFARAITSVWKEVASEGPALLDVVKAVANLTEKDASFFGNNDCLSRLLVLLQGPEPTAPALLALHNLCKLKPVQRALLKNDAFLLAVVGCMRGTDPSLHLLRTQACATLAVLGENPWTLRNVVSAQPFPALFVMVQSTAIAEYEAAMRVVAVLIEDHEFCAMVHIITDFVTAVIARIADSDVAMSLLTTLLLRVCALTDVAGSVRALAGARGKGPTERHAFLEHVLQLDPRLFDVVSAALFMPGNAARRIDAIKLVRVFTKSPTDLKRVADVFLPGVSAFLRTAKGPDETSWGITVLSGLAHCISPETMVQHPGVLMALYKSMRQHGDADAASMLVMLTKHKGAATLAGKMQVWRLTLLTMFVQCSNPEVRDCAAHAATNIYEAGQYDDRPIVNKSPHVLKAIEDMVMYQGNYSGHNGATRLARYMRNRNAWPRAR